MRSTQPRPSESITGRPHSPWVRSVLGTLQAAVAFLGLALIRSAAGEQAATPLTVPLIERLSEELRTNHPALKAARSRTTAADHDVASVRTWQDPEAKFGGVVASSRGPHLEEEGDLVYGVDQKLPLFGKSTAARAVATADAAMESQRAEVLLQTLRRDLSRALFEVALADRVVMLGQEDLQWLEATLGVAQARLNAGAGTQFELLRLQNERARRASDLITDRRRREDAQVTVNRLLARDPAAPFPALELPPVAEPVAYTPALVKFATNTEPRLLLAEREIRVAAARMEATRRSRRPDVAVGIEGRQYSGDGGFREGMFTVGLSLPWLNGGRYRRDLARDRERHSATQHDRDAMLLDVVNEIHHRTVSIDAARREALLYRDDILPRSEQALAVATAGWTSGKMDVRDVLEGRRLLIEARLMLARAVAMQWSEMSDLVLCCGLSDLEMLQQLGRPSNER